MQYFISNLLELIGMECKSPELVTAAKKQFCLYMRRRSKNYNKVFYLWKKSNNHVIFKLGFLMEVYHGI